MTWTHERSVQVFEHLGISPEQIRGIHTASEQALTAGEAMHVAACQVRDDDECLHCHRQAPAG